MFYLTNGWECVRDFSSCFQISDFHLQVFRRHKQNILTGQGDCSGPRYSGDILAEKVVYRNDFHHVVLTRKLRPQKENSRPPCRFHIMRKKRPGQATAPEKRREKYVNFSLYIFLTF